MKNGVLMKEKCVNISGLPLVVAEFHRVWRFGSLCVCICSFLLCHKIGDHRVHPYITILWLHRHNGSDILASYGYYWLLCCLCICP